MGAQTQLIMVSCIFLITYGIIISEKINRTTIAFIGAVLMVILKVLDLNEAFDVIDFNTISLLIGMMIIVNILKRTGLFQYIAIKAAKYAQGEPWRILIMLSIITAASSALLDNVTTVLLITPVTLVVTDALNIDPIPFMIAQILAANIGGTATLIGDPPNIMIGGAAGLGFMDFLKNLAPIVIIIFIVTFFIIKIMYSSKLHVKEELKLKIKDFDEKLALTDKNLMIKSLAVLGFTMLGFMLHEYTGMESATVALAGAAVLLLISKADVEEILQEVEWPTIFFFAFLFILVGCIDKVGIIEAVAKGVIGFTKGNLMMTTLLILWVSAIVSAFIDNIPFVATMIPLIKSIGALSTINITPLWWALALGACLGGNGTLVGASANVVVAGILEKHKHKITFSHYLKVAFPLMIVSIILSTVYLYMFYLR